MIGLDVALDRMLHRRDYRQALIDGRFDALELGAHDVEALASIDHEQLVRTAERIARDLLSRKHRGSGGLAELYPRTLDAWRLAHPEDIELRELAFAFLESEAHDAYRELPFAGPGLSLEEAFFRFCEEEGIGDPAVREQELCAAIMKALLVSPTAEFTLPACVRRAPHGFFAVSARGAPTLHAAVRGRFVSGPLTPLLAELLTSTEAPAEVGARHGAAPEIVAAALERLRALGLV